MTQVSRIQAGNKSVDPTLTDAGPYTATEWSAMFHDMHASRVNDGVLAGVDLRLYPAVSGTDIVVETGAAFVGGHFFKNDVSVTFTPSTPGGATRVDRLVVVQNNTDLPATAGVASGQPFEFPADLTDYAGAAAIAPHTARLAIMIGVEGGGFPAIDSDPATLEMISLATYSISTVPAFSLFVDQRSYAGESTRLLQRLIVPAGETVDIFNLGGGLSSTEYESLRILMRLQTDFAVGEGFSLGQLQFNDDTGNNYDYEVAFESTTVGINYSASDPSTSFIYLADVPGSTDDPNSFVSIIVDILGFKAGTQYQDVLWKGNKIGDPSVLADRLLTRGVGWWNNLVDPVQSIQIRTDNGDFTPGSFVALYGIM